MKSLVIFDVTLTYIMSGSWPLLTSFSRFTIFLILPLCTNSLRSRFKTYFRSIPILTYFNFDLINRIYLLCLRFCFFFDFLWWSNECLCEQLMLLSRRSIFVYIEIGACCFLYRWQNTFPPYYIWGIMLNFVNWEGKGLPRNLMSFSSCFIEMDHKPHGIM